LIAFRFKPVIPDKDEEEEGTEVVKEKMVEPTLSFSRSVCSLGKRDILTFACFGKKNHNPRLNPNRVLTIVM
jgi:hypothetical protein